MFTKNVFTQNDPIADLIKGINEADYKAKMEALKGSQHKIDKNKNNKVDADDFKILRGEKKVNEEEQVEEDTSVKIPTSTGTKVLGHRYGNAAKTHRDSMADPFAVVKGPKQKDIEDLEKKKSVLSEEALGKKQAEFQEEMLKYRDVVGKSQLEIQKFVVQSHISQLITHIKNSQHVPE